MKYNSFTELKVYKKGRELRKAVSAIVRSKFPKEEKFLLTAQILDASRSITANIAEGHGRFYYQDNIRFCRISRGSLEETLDHLITAFDDTYITSEDLKRLKIIHGDCLRLLNGYMRYLKESKRGGDDSD